MERKEITISMDAKVYEEFAKLCDKAGISMQTAFLWFAGMALAKNEIPIDPSDLTIKEDFEHCKGIGKDRSVEAYKFEEYN